MRSTVCGAMWCAWIGSIVLCVCVCCLYYYKCYKLHSLPSINCRHAAFLRSFVGILPCVVRLNNQLLSSVHPISICVHTISEFYYSHFCVDVDIGTDWNLRSVFFLKTKTNLCVCEFLSFC